MCFPSLFLSYSSHYVLLNLRLISLLFFPYYSSYFLLVLLPLAVVRPSYLHWSIEPCFDVPSFLFSTILMFLQHTLHSYIYRLSRIPLTFCLSPSGFWALFFSSFIFLPDLNAVQKECLAAIRPNGADTPRIQGTTIIILYPCSSV